MKFFKFTPTFKEIAILFSLSLLAHFVCLSILFPGYYDPVWPNHSDHYMPAHVANTSEIGVNFWGWPRPIGMYFIYVIGQFGINGSIAAIIFFTLLNTSLSSFFIRKITNIDFDKKYLSLHFIAVTLIFAEPYFYGFYTQDSYAQFSYFLLIFGSIIIWTLHLSYTKTTTISLLFLSTLAFFSKETYALSFLLLAFGYFLIKYKEDRIKSALPFVILCVALIASVIYNKSIESTFVAATDGTYKINLSPTSFIPEWLHYIDQGLNFSNIFMFALIGFLSYKKSLILKKYLFIVAASVLAILPNALLPNHHFVGYSWNGAYLLFAALIFCGIPGLLINKKIFYGIIFLALLSPILNFRYYNNDSNAWLKEQENTQRNLLQAIEVLSKVSVETKKETILITGITFPFGPFDYPNSLRQFQSVDTEYDVLDYGNAKISRNPSVKYIAVDAIDLKKYDQIWVFSSEGFLVNVEFPKRELNSLNMLYPITNRNCQKLLSDEEYKVEPSFAYEIFECGHELKNVYHSNEMALRFYIKSTEVISDNPYAWFAAAQTYEAIGQLKNAAKYFQLAYEKDIGHNTSIINANYERTSSSYIK